MLPLRPYVGDQICSSMSRTLLILTFGLASLLPQWSAMKLYTLGSVRTKTSAHACNRYIFSRRSMVASAGVILILYNFSMYFTTRVSMMDSRWLVEKSMTLIAVWNNSWIMEP